MRYRVAWSLATTAAMAFSFGQVSAVAGPVAPSRVPAVVIHTNAPVDPKDQTKVPHYFGPYPNWANSPQVLADAIVTISNGGGTGAEATATVNPKTGAIGAITVTSPGTGYTSVPDVAITSPGVTPTTGATATAVTSPGVVTGFTVAEAGSGFTTPTVAITGGGSPSAPASARASGGVDGLTIANGGTGYAIQPIVEFSLPNLANGTQPTATATMNANGSVNGITVVTPGSGYTTAPMVTILDGNAVNPTAATVVATIKIGQIDVTSGGVGYSSAPTVTITDSVAPFNKGATATARVAASGAVISINVNTAGAGYLTPGLRKFVDTLPGLGPDAVNNLGQYIPVAVPDTTTYPGTDYYEIAVVQYRMKFSSDLPATLLRGYVQLSTPVVPGAHIQLTNANLDPAVAAADIVGRFGVDSPHYLGPTIVATKDKPVRILFRNLLPTGVDGDLFLPVDTSIMGSGAGPDMVTLKANGVPNDMATDLGTVLDGVRNPMCGETPKPATCYSENRATLHLHGGITPWISDGTPHQWVTPAGETTAYPAGVSVSNVPDMPDPGPGAETFFYTNQQSARLMFYHDHSWGITRLNVYAGEAAGYLLTDPMEQSLIAPGGALDGLGTGTPLIIEDKTFVPANIASTDPTWDAAKWGGEGNLWAPHVYMPAQNPGSPSGMSAFGRWMYGPWFWPPAKDAKYPPIANPYYDPLCDPNVQPFCEPPQIPSTPNISVGMEAFNDTPIVNGTAYPTTAVDPKAYRYRILNASNDRFWNLQWYVADPTTGTLSEVALNPTELAAAQTDPQIVPTPDTTTSPVGPSWVQIGTEGGFLPAPVVVPNQPITWITDPTRFDFGNVDKHALLVAPAERADVIVDFSAYRGKTLILYNDAPAAFPARQANMDYYTGAPDMTASGGTPTVLPGYGPNTRTIMQVKVSSNTPEVAFDRPNTTADRMGALNAAFAHHVDATTGKPAGVFESGSDPIIVGQAAYNSTYGSNFAANGWCTSPVHPSAKCDGFARIQQQGGDSFKFDTLGTTPTTAMGAQLSIPLQPKGIHDEMNSANFDEWGRMTANMGLEAPGATPLLQNIILFPYVNPATEVLDSTGLPSSLNVTPISSAADGTQIWKITHNGVDTHPLHFHLYDVQVINRVTWDNIIIPPDPNELGWKDTVRVSPLEDTYVAVRPIVPTLPFGVPDSSRPLNPAMPLHAVGSLNGPNGTEAGFNNTDSSGNPIAPISNEIVDFGWEYVWHCHMLSHEEMDMMRPVTVHVGRALPATPAPVTSTSIGAVKLTWTDGTPVDYLHPATWTNPGTAEVGYRIERAPVDASNAVNGPYTVVQKDVMANSISFTDWSASYPSPAYSYQVVAFNAAGESTSAPILSAVVTPPTVPDAPVIGTATAGNASATVTWTPPADGGSPITGYSVQVVDATTSAPIGALHAAAPGANSLIVSGLANGTAVKLQVQATNAVGTGPFSALSNTVTPATVPDAPVIGTAIAGNASAMVNWSAPANGGSPITGYSVKVVNAATNVQIGALQSAVAGATSLNFTGLANGTAVKFQVQATNAVGTGAFSALSNTVTPATVPDAPVIGTATAGNASATVTWTTPANGSSPITGYSVKVVNAVTNVQIGGLQPAAAGATSLNVTGLVNGTAVKFQVQATNAMGTGPFSGLSNAVTPVAVPDAPVIGTATAGNGSATVTWTTSASGGSPITGYSVKVVNAATNAQIGGLQPAAASATSLNVTGLVNGTAVAFQVQATNAVGASLFSAMSNAVTPDAIAAFLNRVYRDLFNRGPDPTGLAGWTTALQNGTPRIAVANAMTSSTEYRSALISQSYQTYLGRLPDPAGLANWLNFLGVGNTIGQMESGFVASDEYYAQAGATDSGWVTKLYHDVLGRQAGSSEIAYWVGQLNGGASRTQVSMGFLLSTEHLSAVIDGYYLHFLGRNLDPTGQQTWVSAIQAGGRLENVIGGIIASAEYYALP